MPLSNRAATSKRSWLTAQGCRTRLPWKRRRGAQPQRGCATPPFPNPVTQPFQRCDESRPPFPR